MCITLFIVGIPPDQNSSQRRWAANIWNLAYWNLDSLFPTPWKMDRVCPIFKNGSSGEKSNYKPISILCVLSKILEKHVHNHLYSYLMKYNLIHLAQSGFRKFHSCETALAKMVSQCSTNMIKGNLTGLIFFFTWVRHLTW